MTPYYFIALTTILVGITVWWWRHMAGARRRGLDLLLDVSMPISMGGAIIAAAAAICVVVLVTTPASYGHAERACARYGTQTERDTKMIRTTFWSWDCVVLTDEGWVSTDAIVKVDD